MPEILYGPVSHQEASDFIKDKPVVSREVFDAMLPEVRARTFLISGLVPFDIAQKLRDRIADIPQGGDWDAARKDIADSLSPFFKSDSQDPEAAAQDRAAAERRAELLLRTHGYQAYSAAQYNVLQRQIDVFPYWRYQTAQDDRVRESHAALEGLVIPADDPFWQTHFPPWDFNCRCSVVPLSQADVGEIKDEDQKKAPEERSVLDEQQLARMDTDGTLLRGPNKVVDVRAPRQKQDGDGYAWQPGDLRIPVETLKQRYSPEIWSAFETFAKKTEIENGRTVWDWLKGAPAGRRRVVPITPPQPTSIVNQPAARVNQKPVSQAFDLNAARTTARPIMSAALTAIDRVHDDGDLPAMTLTGRPIPGALGHFSRGKKEIAVSPSGHWPRLTATHEAGHMLDWFALGQGSSFASEADAGFNGWRLAASASSAIRKIQAGVEGFGPRQTGYLLQPREIWARSYAQYIATKSGDAELLRQLDIIRTAPTIGHVLQWSDDDFKPIAAAIDEIFKGKGWIT